MSEEQNLVSDRPPVRSLFLIILNSFFGLLIGSALVLLISSLFYKGDLSTDLFNLDEHPNAAFFMLLMQGVASFVWLVVLPWFHLKFVEHKPLQPFFPYQDKLLMKILLIAAATFCFSISISPIAEWNAEVKLPEMFKEFEAWARDKEDAAAEATKAITTFASPYELILGIIIIGLLPGIGEELVFRGLIQNELHRSTKNIHISIWVSAVLFSAIHFQFFGFFPRMLLGAFFGYLYYWSGTLIVPMFAHFFHNTSTLIALHFYNVKLIETNIEESESAPWPTVVFTIFITVILLVIFKRLFDTKARPHNLN